MSKHLVSWIHSEWGYISCCQKIKDGLGPIKADLTCLLSLADAVHPEGTPWILPRLGPGTMLLWFFVALDEFSSAGTFEVANTLLLHVKLFACLFYLISGGSVVKNLPANARDTGDLGSISRSGRSPGGGNGNPLQCSCLENPMDRRALQTTVRGMAESATTEGLSVHAEQFNRRVTAGLSFLSRWRWSASFWFVPPELLSLHILASICHLQTFWR